MKKSTQEAKFSWEHIANLAPLWLWVAKSVRRFQDARAGAYPPRPVG